MSPQSLIHWIFTHIRERIYNRQGLHTFIIISANHCGNCIHCFSCNFANCIHRWSPSYTFYRHVAVSACYSWYQQNIAKITKQYFNWLCQCAKIWWTNKTTDSIQFKRIFFFHLNEKTNKHTPSFHIFAVYCAVNWIMNICYIIDKKLDWKMNYSYKQERKCSSWLSQSA